MQALAVTACRCDSTTVAALLSACAAQVHNPLWACREKGADQSTCEVLMDLAQEQNIDLLVVGSFGRKGEKL